MHPRSFITLIEEEFTILHRSATEAAAKYGFNSGERPFYICREVQKFRNWLAYAIRSVDLTVNGEKVSAEDAIIFAASSRSDVGPFKLLHPKLVNALSLFVRGDFDAIFGPSKLETFEKSTNTVVSTCQFDVCYFHCANSVQEHLLGERSNPNRDSAFYPN